MKDHIKIVAWLYIVMGILGIFGALVVFAVIAGGGLISGDETAIRITMIVGIVIASITALLSVPGIIAGVGLLGYKAWARILAIILALLNLPGFPVGTLLGIYSLWVLLDSESTLVFSANP